VAFAGQRTHVIQIGDSSRFSWEEIVDWGNREVWEAILGRFPERHQQREVFEPIYVPPVIAETPETWDELEELDPELFEPILETRPGRIPDNYPQPGEFEELEEFVRRRNEIVVDPSPAPPPDENGEDDMAHDWGHLVRQGIGAITGVSDPGPNSLAPGIDWTQPVGTGTVLRPGADGDCDGMQWSGGTPPKGYKVVNSCGVGVLRKVRRRRRRRLLTASDSRDIATIVGLVGKGQMASALINRR